MYKIQFYEARNEKMNTRKLNKTESQSEAISTVVCLNCLTAESILFMNNNIQGEMFAIEISTNTINETSMRAVADIPSRFLFEYIMNISIYP